MGFDDVVNEGRDFRTMKNVQMCQPTRVEGREGKGREGKGREGNAFWLLIKLKPKYYTGLPRVFEQVTEQNMRKSAHDNQEAPSLTSARFLAFCSARTACSCKAAVASRLLHSSWIPLL